MHPLSVLLHFPLPLCINHGDKSSMIGVVARHPDACALKSSTVGFPSQEVVAPVGDSSPPPPHPPRPLSPELFPQALIEVSGHVNQFHGIHLLRNRLLSLRAWGTKIEVQVANQNGMSPHRTLASGCFDTHQCFQIRGWDVAPHNKNRVDPTIKCKEMTLEPQICVSLILYKLLSLQKRAIPPCQADGASEVRTLYPLENRV